MSGAAAVASGLVIAPTRIAQPRPKFPAASAIQATPAAACGRRKRHAGPGRSATDTKMKQTFQAPVDMDLAVSKEREMLQMEIKASAILSLAVKDLKVTVTQAALDKRRVRELSREFDSPETAERVRLELAPDSYSKYLEALADLEEAEQAVAEVRAYLVATIAITNDQAAAVISAEAWDRKEAEFASSWEVIFSKMTDQQVADWFCSVGEHVRQ